jgi:hypothetical protein
VTSPAVRRLANPAAPHRSDFPLHPFIKRGQFEVIEILGSSVLPKHANSMPESGRSVGRPPDLRTKEGRDPDPGGVAQGRTKGEMRPVGKWRYALRDAKWKSRFPEVALGGDAPPRPLIAIPAGSGSPELARFSQSFPTPLKLFSGVAERQNDGSRGQRPRFQRVLGWRRGATSGVWPFSGVAERQEDGSRGQRPRFAWFFGLASRSDVRPLREIEANRRVHEELQAIDSGVAPRRTRNSHQIQGLKPLASALGAQTDHRDERSPTDELNANCSCRPARVREDTR